MIRLPLLVLFLVEGFRLAARDAERLPLRRLEVLGEEDYLPRVLAVVRELSVDGLDDCVRLAAYENLARQVFAFQRRERVEESAPARLPLLRDCASVFAFHEEFRVAVSVGLLAVGRQKIRPARAHVAREVLHDEGDAVRLGVNRAEELLVVQLLNGPVGEPLQSAELRDDVLQVVLCERVSHMNVLHLIRSVPPILIYSRRAVSSQRANESELARRGRGRAPG